MYSLLQFNFIFLFFIQTSLLTIHVNVGCYLDIFMWEIIVCFKWGTKASFGIFVLVLNL